MPPPIRLMTILGQQRCQQIVSSRTHTTHSKTGCWVPNNLSPNADGYYQIQVYPNGSGTGRTNQRGVLLHRVSFVARYGRDCAANMQISPLCGNRGCFNPDHIREEDPVTNNSRKGCAGKVECPWHGHIIADVCSHQPPCIKYHTSTVSCCLKISQSDGWGELGASSRPSTASQQ